MDGGLLSISKIFTERLLRIPDYQRGYAWSLKEVNDYWTDLVQLEEGRKHYVGVLTLEDVPVETVNEWREDHWIIKHRGYQPYYVVDGQQRLTTTIILIQAIVEQFEKQFPVEDENEEVVLNFTPMKEIRNKFIFMNKEKGASRSYLFGYEKDNPSYEFLKTRIFKENSQNHGPIEETIYTTNLSQAKEFFMLKLSELSLEEYEKIYEKVTQYFVFNIYSLHKEIDTYVAFETMNNRGKQLSHLELLKNRLIYLTTKLEEEKYEKDILRHSINECWKSIYHYLGKSKDNPLDDDDFLYSHFNLYFDSDEPQFNVHLYNRMKLRKGYKDLLLDDIFSQKSLRVSKEDGSQSHLSIDYIHSYVSNLKESVEYWYDIFNPSSQNLSEELEKWLFKIHKIQNWESSAPLILSIFRHSNCNDERLKFLKCLERTLYIEYNIFSRYRIVERGELLNLAKKLNSGIISCDDIVVVLNAKVEEALKKYRLVWTKEFAKTSDFYNWSGIRYTLFEYELYLLSKQKSDRTKLVWGDFKKTEPWKEFISVEHIYPQTPRANYWIDRFNYLDGNKRKKLKNSIGNLVPLSKSKNSSLSNKPFPEKVEKGFRNGCYSEIEVAAKDEWLPSTIIERNLKLLKFIDKRWKLGLGNSNEILLQFCGLDEIEKIVSMHESKRL